jgi:hypothetical protein
MVIVSRPSYSPDVASSDFALFFRSKMKLKGRRFETVSDVQRESQAMLDSIKENDLRCFGSMEGTMGSLYTLSQHFF